jgi:hypothetical protein
MNIRVSHVSSPPRVTHQGVRIVFVLETLIL